MRLRRSVVHRLPILLLAAPAIGVTAGLSDEFKARQWVDDLPRHGVYTDGYVPHDPPSPMTMAGQSRMLPAALLDFYVRAWETFLAQDDLSEAQQQARHYKIGHAIEGDTLIVVVQGLRLPRIVDGRAAGIMRVAVGPSMRLRFDLGDGHLIGTELLR